ncbi:GyrI-like domain-containing protein [Paenibacillus sp. SI8]|uniref:GyrI-like domain-containing protein n=1 Tax=unclassified Paenibacillus TaxID=185978 RepID=UPI0034673DE3
MEKLDLAKMDKTYYTAPDQPQLVDFDPISYVTIGGKGDPNGQAFANATEALYTLAYSVKGISKKEEQDFTVAKLEGLWWVEGERDAMKVPRDEWNWKLMIRLPSFVTSEQVQAAQEIALKKKKGLEELKWIQYEAIHEGRCVQMMHIGPYSTEKLTVQRIQTFMEEKGLSPNGKHHEIYLSDPRKVDPAKMKTILRYPVK